MLKTTTTLLTQQESDAAARKKHLSHLNMLALLALLWPCFLSHLSLLLLLLTWFIRLLCAAFPMQKSNNGHVYSNSNSRKARLATHLICLLLLSHLSLPHTKVPPLQVERENPSPFHSSQVQKGIYFPLQKGRHEHAHAFCCASDALLSNKEHYTIPI